jgi:hypothetical protein
MILVLTVLIVGVFVWWFAISQAGITSSTYASEVGDSIEKLEERFVVEHVQIAGDTVNIWVYNIGKIDVNITNVYVESHRHAVSVDLPIEGFVQISIGGLVEAPEFIQVESERGTVVIGFP